MLCLFIMSFMFLQKMQAQVSIGGGIPPQESALLELKESDPDSDNVTATKGFLMSRVKLTSRSSLYPLLPENKVTDSVKLNNEGLQVFHVGGNNISKGVKVWDGTNWSDLNNYDIEAKNGVINNADTLELGGSLNKSIQLNAAKPGVNFEYYSNQENANMLITGNAKLGVNTTSPESTVDINGDLTVRNIPVLEEGFFNDIGVDQTGKIYKRNDAFTSYSVYLGFDPMATSHTDTIPLSFEPGYIYKMEGMSVGACQGVLVYFTATFIGNRYLGATLQAVASKEGDTTVYDPVTLTPSQPFFNTDISLEYMAGATKCRKDAGHKITYLPDSKQIIVSYYDKSPFYKDSGTFAITNLIQLKIVGSD